MAKFYGEIGYAESNVETAPGVYTDQLVEYSYYGDVIRNTRGLEDGQSINNDLTVSNSISIVADAYAREHFFAMRYIKWAGALWTISDVDASRPPRLILRLGGVYNGPTAPAPDSPGEPTP
jgi:hypothetical protein